MLRSKLPSSIECLRLASSTGRARSCGLGHKVTACQHHQTAGGFFSSEQRLRRRRGGSRKQLTPCGVQLVRVKGNGERQAGNQPAACRRRELFVRQRTGLTNALRGHLAEFGSRCPALACNGGSDGVGGYLEDPDVPDAAAPPPPAMRWSMQIDARAEACSEVPPARGG